MNEDQLSLLFKKYFNKEATVAERDAFFRLLAQSDTDQPLAELLAEAYRNYTIEKPLIALDSQDMYERIQRQAGINITTNRKLVPMWKWAAAAVAILLLTSVFALLRWHPKENAVVSEIAVVKPAGKAGYLTLGNGQRISLDSLSTGLIALEDGIMIQQDTAGLLSYEAAGAGGTSSTNTLETSNGQFMRLKLPDGTMVWLNANSSLSYPSRFASVQREVSLQGEAYFEVAHKAESPFVVDVQGQSVLVLGTKFNIKSYVQGQNITTLLEGKVRVGNAKGDYAVLKPGQEALLLSDQIQVREVEVEEAIAWKSGYFAFTNKTLGSIMEDIARWYNVELIYENPRVKSIKLIGSISRHSDINVLLERMSMTKEVQFKLEGRKLYIK